MPVLDATYLVRTIMESSEQGLREALEEVMSIAKDMAPVRSIFKIPRRRNYLYSQSLATGARFVGLNGKAYRMSAATAKYAPVAPGGMPARTGRSFQRGTGLQTGKSSSRVTGRANSTSPVIKTQYGYVGGKSKVGGTDSRALRKVLHSQSGSGFELEHKEIRVNGHTIGTSDLLSQRGRYEVMSGRAKTGVGPGDLEIGGTLRDSIHIEGPFASKGGFYGFVTAFAENEKGLNYGYFMEFGSRHNRPHPFMRPALWAATDHGQLSKAMIRGIKGAKITTGELAGGITLKATVKLEGFTQLQKMSIRDIFPIKED
jgi:hypothetical protein